MTRSIGWTVAGIAIVFALASCGERPQVIEYKQGTYQGKRDEQAWSGPPWNGNRNEWVTAIRVRNQYQNEFKRTN